MGTSRTAHKSGEDRIGRLRGVAAEYGSESAKQIVRTRAEHDDRGLVHQIELEMQNEELRKAQEQLVESLTKYSDLYDSAPVGYVTTNREGLILEANLTFAGQLGI